MKSYFCLLLLSAWGFIFPTHIEAQGLPWKQSGEEFPFVEKADLKLPEHRGSSMLTLDKTVIHANETVSADLRFNNDYYGAETVFNPFLNSLLELPAEMAVYDSNKNYLGNWWRNSFGSRVSPRPEDYVYIAGGSYVGTNKKVGLYYLSPGEYYLQVIWKNSFLRNGPAGRSYRGELLRSNAVKITITQ
jgi:hypothetical protein